MKGNILETMKELGAAIDDRVELEYLLTLKDEVPSWHSEPCQHFDIPELKVMVSCGEIRTKPRTVEVRLLYHGNDIDPWEAELFDDDSVKRNCRTSIHTIPLDGE